MSDNNINDIHTQIFKNAHFNPHIFIFYHTNITEKKNHSLIKCLGMLTNQWLYAMDYGTKSCNNIQNKKI